MTKYHISFNFDVIFKVMDKRKGGNEIGKLNSTIKS
jgi:hypothetical protein